MSAKLSPELEAKIRELAEKEGKSFVEMEVELLWLAVRKKEEKWKEKD